MIGWLGGVLRDRRGSQLVVDCGGVGYLVTVPAGVCGQTPIGEPVELHIETRVREDDISLYGFEDLAQQAAFDSLTAVKGVGPALGINILSGMGPDELAVAVESGDVARLKALKGVGKKLAERLSLELKGKLVGLGSGGAAVLMPGTVAARPGGARSGEWAELASALTHLQYTTREIDGVIAQLQAEHPEGGKVEKLVVEALGLLRRV